MLDLSSLNIAALQHRILDHGLSSSAIIASLLAIFLAERIWSYQRGIWRVANLPGIRCLFEPFTALASFLPQSEWNPTVNFTWQRRHTLYKTYGMDTISVVPSIWGEPRIWTANLSVARQVASGIGSAWIRPYEWCAILAYWGMNLFTAEDGEVWRRHRRIMAPAFNNKTYSMVWNETMRLYREMNEHDGWADKQQVDISKAQAITFKLALYVISCCGFGLPFTWAESPTGSDGSMSLQEALRIVSESMILHYVLPKWAYKLPIKTLQRTRRADEALEGYMRAQVAARKAAVKQEIEASAHGQAAVEERENLDVFTRLVFANESETEKLRLDDQELIGNVFLLLVAGHETTGHTLAATLGFLSLYQEEQEIVYRSIMEIVGHDRDPTFEDYPALNKVLAAFYESLRMIPVSQIMVKKATSDTTLQVPLSLDKDVPTPLSISKDSLVIVDSVGLQYNPRYHPEPNKFKPSRWYEQEDSKSSETLTAFGFGPRLCIGRKFASTEAVCFLTMLLRDWHLDIVLQDGETREQWRDRVMDARVVMTLAVNPVPIRMTRREV